MRTSSFRRLLVHKLTFLAVSIFGFLCCQALADQVSLKNGDRLSGTIVKSDGKTLVLHTDYAGDITLKWDAVQGIESGEALHVELQDGKTVVGPVTTSGDTLMVETKVGGGVCVSRSTVKSLRNDVEQAAYEKTAHPGLLQDWKAGLNVGFALTGGNSQTENLSLAFIGTRQTLRDKLGVYSNALYATNNAPGAVPATTANTIGGGLRYHHDVTKRSFRFVAVGLFSAAFQGFNLRSVFRGGPRHHPLTEDHTT